MCHRRLNSDVSLDLLMQKPMYTVYLIMVLVRVVISRQSCQEAKVTVQITYWFSLRISLLVNIVLIIRGIMRRVAEYITLFNLHNKCVGYVLSLSPIHQWKQASSEGFCNLVKVAQLRKGHSQEIKINFSDCENYILSNTPLDLPR